MATTGGGRYGTVFVTRSIRFVGGWRLAFDVASRGGSCLGFTDAIIVVLRLLLEQPERLAPLSAPLVSRRGVGGAII